MKKMTFLKCIALVLFVVISRPLQAQYDSLLNILSTNYPQEKIYVHYDRPYYNPGETIWFKAYVFAGNMPSLISKTLYAELLDDKGAIIQRKTIPVFGAGAASEFSLPDTMRSSLVYIRAYTPWMLNFDSSFLYLKPVRVITTTAAAADKVKKDPVYSLQFFPEGGDLVQGLESKVAFKAVDDLGFPIPVKGDIIDSKKQKIVSFSDMHDGMGFFMLNPSPGEQYKAVWKDSKGMNHETVLPAAKPSGVILSVNNTGTDLMFTLTRSEDIPAEARVFQIVAQVQQQPVYIARINMTNKTNVSAPIPGADLPDGIVQVTLFNSNQQPLAERIVFVNHNNYYFITDIHTQEKNLTRKAKNVLQVDVGDTLLSNLSISVTDAGPTQPQKDEENIFSHVLLSSDIKGYVHNPGYYFSGTADSIQAHLDLVMMTNGWRRFKWEDVVAGKWPVIKNFPESYVSVKGKVLGLLQSDLAGGKNLSMILETKKGGNQFLMVPVSPKGEFSVDDLVFYDTAKLYYQFNNDKNKKLTSTASFDFRNSFIQLPDRQLVNLRPLPRPILPDTAVQRRNQRLTALKKNDFVEGREVKELQAVEVTGRQKSTQQKMDEEYTSGFFSGGDGYTFVIGDDPAAGSMTVLDYLRGRVAGLQISNTGPDGGELSWRGGTPSLFLNEMNTDVSMIQSTSMNDVAMIKVFRPPFFGAPGGGSGGAIAVYTKKGAATNSSAKGLDFISITGYTPAREFYSPDYSASADKDKGDYRTTLYWNPYLVFDKSTRRVLIPFYNNDNCKKIRVVIEGLNAEGKMTREEKYFE